jgi:hypothetical protein
MGEAIIEVSLGSHALRTLCVLLYSLTRENKHDSKPVIYDPGKRSRFLSATGNDA